MAVGATWSCHEQLDRLCNLIVSVLFEICTTLLVDTSGACSVSDDQVFHPCSGDEFHIVGLLRDLLNHPNRRIGDDETRRSTITRDPRSGQINHQNKTTDIDIYIYIYIYNIKEIVKKLCTPI